MVGNHNNVMKMVFNFLECIHNGTWFLDCNGIYIEIYERNGDGSHFCEDNMCSICETKWKCLKFLECNENVAKL